MPKFITQDYQKKFLKDSVFHSSTMRDYQRKIGFLILILGLYAKILRISRKLIKIEIFFGFFKNKKPILPFYNLFFLQKNRLFCFTTNRIFIKTKNSKNYKKTHFWNLKVVCHATDIPTFPTFTIFYMYEQPKPFLMISQKLIFNFFA
jgi:hypothetical protein